MVDVISLIVSIVSLLVSAGVSICIFYVGHKRTKKSEEIHISREIWDRIDMYESIIEKWTVEDRSSENTLEMINAMDSLTNELGYFVYLMENREITNYVIREYYRKRLLPVFRTLKFIDKQYPESKESSGTKKVYELIEKYHKVVGKREDYNTEFV
jgi:hypothetical protein